jgi:hypothetical protein
MIEVSGQGMPTYPTMNILASNQSVLMGWMKTKVFFELLRQNPEN